MSNSDFLPRIRVEKIRLQNFKGVKNGVVEFNCLKNPFEKDIQADILGLYGQNGSGKTTLLEALKLMSLLIGGSGISCADFCGLDPTLEGSARIEVCFQCVNLDESLFHVEYGFSLKVDDIPHYVSKEEYDNFPDYYKQIQEVMKDEENGRFYDMGDGSIATASSHEMYARAVPVDADSYYLGSTKKVVIFDETLRLSGKYNGEEVRFGPFFDASPDDEVFIPKAKHTVIFPINTNSALKELREIKNVAREESRSFIFSDELISILVAQHNQGAKSPLGNLIRMLRKHVEQNVRVLDSRHIDWTSGSYSIEFFTPERRISVSLKGLPTIMTDENLKLFKRCLDGFNVVLNQLIPGLSLNASEEESTVQSNIGFTKRTVEKIWNVTVYSVRNGMRVNLSEESKGILHLISMLGLFSFAFSNPCATVAIDEIDAGVYEYLLGEMILVFEEYGCGQLIFTCHNLRPLEVLNKKFVCFTTTNPSNRYIKPKSIRNENNLRDVYLREIITGGQEEELYSSTKHSLIASALQKAGEAYE